DDASAGGADAGDGALDDESDAGGAAVRELSLEQAVTTASAATISVNTRTGRQYARLASTAHAPPRGHDAPQGVTRLPATVGRPGRVVLRKHDHDGRAPVSGVPPNRVVTRGRSPRRCATRSVAPLLARGWSPGGWHRQAPAPLGRDCHLHGVLDRPG